MQRIRTHLLAAFLAKNALATDENRILLLVSLLGL